jgi:hypothetical protein
VRQLTDDVGESVNNTVEEKKSDEYYAFKVNTAKLRDLDTLKFMIENVACDVLIDSGATCNQIGETEYKKLADDNPSLRLRNTDGKVFNYGSSQPLELISKCALRIDTGKDSCVCDFMIVSGEYGEKPTLLVVSGEYGEKPTLLVVSGEYGEKPTLLGRKTSEDLGVLRVGYEVNACGAGASGGSFILKEMRKKYPAVFTGLGKLKNYKLKLHIDENVMPIAQHRRIPFNHRSKVSDKLSELESLDVIERVTGPTSWANPLVTVAKPDDIRLCLDMRRANEAIRREKHPVPTVDEAMQEI